MIELRVTISSVSVGPDGSGVVTLTPIASGWEPVVMNVPGWAAEEFGTEGLFTLSLKPSPSKLEPEKTRALRAGLETS